MTEINPDVLSGEMTDPFFDRELLTRQQAAQLCNLSPQAIDYWVRTKGLKYQYDESRTVKLFARIDIEEMDDRMKMRIVGKHF